ncbi:MULTISPECIES: LysR family transcriptional regulator [unclassified Paenibacillus]|uniref:LysR family transcriptional regulator n=1 Tax=unclassified Paenibacillus TaxID=185978 RepID=UPI00096D7777|nr:LysR family transcriptional regulator [Paenibacillus sp. FSL H7-0331]OMF18789.1 LysR family transcriptional regulator [Paenibacillus sp. FSL H7-0331]
MDIRQLSYFVEVARLKSFTKASQTLLVSQPSISKTIKNLEDELGVLVLNRSEKEVELTDAGHLVYEQALHIMQSMKDLSLSIHELVQVKRGKVVMGLMPTVGALLFPQIIVGFKSQYPGIDIQMVEYSAKHLEVQVNDGHIDFGVTVLPVDTGLYGTFSLLKEDLVAIVDSQHWLASKESVDLKELEEEPFILFSKEFVLYDVVIQACWQAGFEPRVVHMSSMWDLVCEMVANQQGISLIPRSMASRLKHLPIHTAAITSPAMVWELALIYRRNQYLSYASREFIAYIQTHLPNQSL